MRVYERGGVLGIAAAIVIFTSTVGETWAQTAPAPPMSTAEMAKAIARAIEAASPKSPNGLIVFESATAHDNVIEIQYAMKDATFFARNKTSLDGSKLALARYYCHPTRVAFLNSGGIVHQVTLAPDNHDRFEITIDRGSCASLPLAKPADAQTLARMAEAVAARENSEKVASTTKGTLQFDIARAHNGIVDLHFIVADASVGQNMKAKPAQLTGFFNGYLCSKYGSDIDQGLSIHEVLTLADGTAVIDFTTDRSACGP